MSYTKKWLKSNYKLKVGSHIGFLLLFIVIKSYSQQSIMLSIIDFDRIKQTDNYEIQDTSVFLHSNNNTIFINFPIYYYISFKKNRFIRPGASFSLRGGNAKSESKNVGSKQSVGLGKNYKIGTTFSMDFGLTYKHKINLQYYYGLGIKYKNSYKQKIIGNGYETNNLNQNIISNTSTYLSSGWGVNVYSFAGLMYYKKNFFIGTEIEFGAEILHKMHITNTIIDENFNLTTNSTTSQTYKSDYITYPSSFLSYLSFPFINIGYTFKKNNNGK